MSTARFRIRNLTTSGAWSDFDDAGFDAAAGDELELQLEASPALDINMTQFLCTDRSAGRAAPVFDPVTGIAATATTGVSMTLPAGEVGTWAIECQTNGGGDGTADSAADNRKTRYVAVRTVNLDLRHPLAGETSQYVAAGGWAVALQELQDAVDVGAAGAVPATRTITAGTGLTGGGDLSADRTINVAVNADGGLIATANEMQLGTLGFARVAAALAAASASIDVNAQKIVDLATPTNPTDAATKGYVDGVAGGLDALTAVLEDTDTALNANGVPIRNLAVSLLIGMNGDVPLRVGRNLEAGADQVLDVLDVEHLDGGTTGDVNGGAAIRFRMFDDVGTERTFARIAARTTVADAGSWAGAIDFYAGAAAASTLAATLTGAGLWTTVGAMRSDAGFDRSTAGVTQISGSVATGTAIGPANSTATTTVNGVTSSIYNGITTTKTVGRRLRQTTASDATDTVRFSPSDDAEAHARVSGADRTFLFRFTPLEPTTTGTMLARWERDLGAGGGYGDMFQWVSSSPIQALAGIYVARLIISSTSGGIWFDASNNRIVVGASGGMQLISADGDDPQLLRSAVDSGGTDAIRSWANGATKTSAQAIHAFGSGTTYAGVSAVRGDGVYHGPAMHFGSLVTATALDAKVCTSYEIDATTCVTVHLDQALVAYDGYEIEVINLGTSTNTVTFDVASGGASTNIIDAGVSASTKTASGAGFAIRFKCLGGDGWVVTRRYLC